jgi:signal transduction histidine kinase
MTRHRVLGIGGRRAAVVVAIAALIVAVVLVVLGVELAGTQSRARQTLTSRFTDRARVVSALIQAEVSSVASSTATTRAYAAPDVSRRVLDQAVKQSQLAFAVVLTPDGRVIADSHSMTAADLSQALASPAFARVRSGAAVSLSDVQPGDGDVVDLVVTLRTPAGPRVLVSGLPAGLLRAFLGTYLARVPERTGAAFVLDSRGSVVATSSPLLLSELTTRSPVPPAKLAHEASGPYGAGRYFTSAPIPDSSWRVVLTTTSAALFSSVNGSRQWLPWVIFIALGLMAVSFLVLLRRLLANAAALRRANAELESSNTRLQSTNELLRRAAELSRSNAELEQFASIASHDLQEPLRKVQTFAAQLNATEADNLSEQGQDFLHRMSDAAGRMRSLIDDLLMFSRVSTKGHPFTEVNLGHVIAQVLLDLEGSIEETGAQVRVDLMPTIDADPLQMRQLLQNLIGNALKFRRPGVTPEVRVSAIVVKHVAELTVADNGIGFDEQYATRIFRAFERLHGSRAYPGTGIGLALCRKIVERHHGTITATAELDHGAAFTVRLPVTQPDDSPDPPLSPQMIEDEIFRVHA